MLAWVVVMAALTCVPDDEGQGTILPVSLRWDFDPAVSLATPIPRITSLDPAWADESEQERVGHEENGKPSDLTLLNFFSEGWDQPWVKRARPDTAPNTALLRVTTNFLEREFRLDYARTHHVEDKPTVGETDLLNGLIAYGLNRRLMIEVIANYEWDHAPDGSTATDVNGPGAAGLVRFQLVDTWTTSFDFQVRLSAPNKGIGQTQSTIAFSSGGFQDLQQLLGIRRLGLYESLQFQTYPGPHKDGAKQNDLGYDVSLAMTWTEPDLFPIANLTTFVEAFATTDLDGDRSGHTTFTVTPGIRFWFARENSLTLGVDLPVNEPHPWSEVFRVTYILNF